MVEAITPLQMALLRMVAKNPGIRRERLLEARGATAEDLAYLERHDMIREREADCFRISHFGEMVLRRGA